MLQLQTQGSHVQRFGQVSLMERDHVGDFLGFPANAGVASLLHANAKFIFSAQSTSSCAHVRACTHTRTHTHTHTLAFTTLLVLA
jgi:hypothetical protein